MERINENAAFDKKIGEEDLFLLFKHSSTCPISQAAYEEYETFANENMKVKTYYLVVQEDRPLSNHIAESFQIKHESPQAILFKKSEPVWHASHWKITNDSLAKAMKENE
ncbi:bacillithiol system redox-active protein YtxJ [Cytobacillus solani]|uniref:Thioredoxin n=1 Tax=Cytobacillus solani TaxID=1637975 RepID=A0A0Q3VIU5_9BACI|nr:bacillithiol system redox-active protein YtxJ [Cytobacillus solani]KOP83765.1 thioredoxin [Bacillus sp. FJAT-21945]KQL20843.1 thioredoxin [Cytobacillus solani]USK54082.1 bacillithiol system redox-active protein YtxJ [Cytobacillus solani]